MTKTLTEQWKNDELENGYYYVKVLDNKKDVFMLHLIHGHFEYSSSFIKEVLAPVPSYDEYKEMDDDLKDMCCKYDTVAMENGRLQEQLKEANEIIKQYKSHEYLTPETFEMRKALEDHCKKWGVK